MSQSNARSMRARPRSGPPVTPDAPRLIVKFRDSLALPYQDGAERLLIDLTPEWGRLPNAHSFRLNRLFTALSATELADLVARAKERDPLLPNFQTFFVVDAAPGHHIGGELVEHLRALPFVEHAYWDLEATDPLVDPDDDDPGAGWVQSQGYFDPAPDGIDAEFAWPRANGSGFAGGDGAGVRFVDLEQGWSFAHPDLAAHNIMLLHGANRPQSAAHGNMALGVVCARDNTIGCVGIAPWVETVAVVSHFQSTKADAIMAGLSNLDAGDVLLIEAQIPEVIVGTTTWGAMPVEVQVAEFWLIRLATALGVTVVEAAGNSFELLDDYVDTAGQRPLNRANPALGFRDSGAILVSAATSAAPHAPITDAYGMPSYHHGSRVDCYAWGENVTTLTDTGYATGGFASTSAAAAIIAGAAAILQGVAKANGRVLDPAVVRNILSDPVNGTESANGAAIDGLGVMPDFRKILLTNNGLGILPDVYLRDFDGDTGAPHQGQLSASPDVILSPTAVVNPQSEFGDPAKPFGSEAIAGQTNYLYVRAWNRGNSDAHHVAATVYWAEPATLVSPDQWTLVGSVDIPLVQAANILTVSPAIAWPAASIPASGHYCFVATLYHPKDPGANPLDLANLTAAWTLDWENFLALVRVNNNITWRNFNVIDTANKLKSSAGPAFRYLGPCLELPFAAVGAPDKARHAHLRVVDRLPEGSRVFLQIPVSLHAWALAAVAGPCNGREPLWHELGGGLELILLARGVTNLPGLPLPARSRLRQSLVVTLPTAELTAPASLYVSQLLNGKEVGRVTWRLE